MSCYYKWLCRNCEEKAGAITGDALFQTIKTTGRFFHVGAVVITQCLVNGIFCGLLKSVLISLSIFKTVKSVETISDLLLIISLVLMQIDGFMNMESFQF